MRIVRACRDLGLASVAVFSEADRAARHVRMADEAVPIGPSQPAQSYLRVERLIAAARAVGADAIHPGYGFLSENVSFALACRAAGLTLVGPSPEAMALLGDKAQARRVAAAVGVPVVPGSDAPLGPEASDAAIADVAHAVGYPLMVKAVAGGGGRGLRAVPGPEDLADAVCAARSEAAAAFGEAAIYLERTIARARHVEVQVLADHFGTVVPFVERECSIQRRHQKVIEESPSPVVSEALRARLMSAATAVATRAGYTNAGTVEFLVEETGAFYFLEMNTRLQVEHAITEMVTGVDLVTWQLRIAGGDRLDLVPSAVATARGHAIECRVYAEDPDAGFLPSPGRISALRLPAGPGLRDDCGVEVGSDISAHYDPLIAKIAAWGEDRRQAIARMVRAIGETEVGGVATSLPFFTWVLRQPWFIAADTHVGYHTGYLDALLHERHGESFVPVDASHEEVALVAAALYRAMSPAQGDRTVCHDVGHAVCQDVAGRDTPEQSRSGWPAVADTPRRALADGRGPGRVTGRGTGLGQTGWTRVARLEAVGA